VDGLYLREMAAKIRRGLAGQLERGFATGGATYGYRAVPVPDPSGRLDPNGYPALLGKRLEVNDAEAAVIRRIFEEYATVAGGPTIVERLNVEGVKGPRGGRWQYGAVKRLLANERFTGKQIWGQRRFERRPGTRQLVARPVPRTEWRILERPELRIISDDLWTAVQRRRLAIAQASRQAMTGRMRGKDATLHSRHLFSGFLRCAICGGAITIVGGGYGSPRYGCIRRSKNGLSSCRNGLTVRAKVADAALLAGLRAKLLHPDTVGYITNRLAAALSAVMDARPKQRAELERARAVAQGKLKNLIAALEDGAGGAFMLKAIQDRETEIVALSDQLGALDGDLRNRLAVMPSWVRRQIEDTAGLLSESHDRARTEFRRLGIRFTVEPVHDEGPRPFLRAHGEGDFEQLAFRESTPLQPFTTVARSDPRSRR
jgi:hypothetical protein